MLTETARFINFCENFEDTLESKSFILLGLMRLNRYLLWRTLFCNVALLTPPSYHEYLLISFRIKKLLNEKKAKSERENGMIYHARLPEVGRCFVFL